MIELLRYLLKFSSWYKLVMPVVLGIFAGFANMILILIINHFEWIDQKWGTGGFLTVFMAFILAYALISFFSLFFSSYFTRSLLVNLRKDIKAKLLFLPVDTLRAIGKEHLFIMNTEDLVKIESYLNIIPRTISQIIVLIGMLIYLLALSIPLTLICLLIFVLSLGGKNIVLKLFKKHFDEVHNLENRQLHYNMELVHGLRELREDESAQKEFSSALDQLWDKYYAHLVKVKIANQFNMVAFGIFLFIFLGIITLYYGGHPNMGLRGTYIIPILFFFGACNYLFMVQEQVYETKGALMRLKKLDESSATTHFLQGFAMPSFKELALQDVSYFYKNGEKSIEIGPFNFEISAGEISFITGGNGRGKSTLVKVLTGLYPAQAGRILVNQDVVKDPVNNSSYHLLFSVIYQSPHIFSSLRGIEYSRENEEKFSGLIKLVELDTILKRKDFEFLNLKELSYGQSKRVALVCALMQNKPIYVFDEWAADQDPHFRKLFYEEILPSLKRQNKAVLAVTHDKEYFNCADRLIEFG